MLICPLALESCDRPDCRSGVCERTGELCLAACLDCGELVEVGALAWRLCGACSATESAIAEGA